ncbi:MAG: glycosyltransferase, partial [Longicatena sp.]
KIMNGTAYYEIPMPAGIPYFGASIEDKIYYKGVFYYLALRLNSLKKVYCHFNFVIHHDLAQLLKEKLHAKIVFTLHYTDWSFDLLGDREWLKHILKNPSGIKGKRVADKIEMEKRFMLEVCDYVIAIARHSYNMLKEVYGIPESKLVCIPNGLRDEYKKRNFEERQRLREKYGFKENEKLLIFAGRLDLVKGIIELIEAFKLIQIENSSVRLIIAGSGSLTRCFEAASPIWSHITFTGFIPKEQLDELYAISDIGIVPSIHEEFGYVATEMMLNELPVIVHNTTGLKEIVNDGKYGITFDFGKNRDVYMLKNIIVNALEQIEKGISLPNGRDKVLSTYSIQSFSERIVDVYLKCD